MSAHCELVIESSIHLREKGGAMTKTVAVRAGGWRTLESYWNTSGTAFFRMPAGAQIKVRYGVGFLGVDSMKQRLDGVNTKTLRVGGGSLAYARMQIKVQTDTNVTYDLYPGDFPSTDPGF